MSAAHILVVEDERLVATALQNELEQFGYQVSGIASSAKEAVAQAVEKKPDLVLMDIHLKGDEDGIDAAQRIHATCGIPVVYLSAFFDAETVARASETEAFGYLLKPYEEQELHTTIEMSLAKHRAEQQLEETRRWLSAIHDSIDDAVIATDPDNNIRFLNFATEALTGWRKEEALGMALTTICNLVNGNGPIDLEDLADRAVHESRIVDLPIKSRLVSRNGPETPIEGSLAPIYDARGEYLGTVVALRDITTRLEIERLARQSDDRLRRTQKMAAVGRLAGGLSGQLDNLLAAILSNSSLALAGSTADDDGLKLLQDIEASAQKASSLVQRLRMFSLFVGGTFSELRLLDLGLLIPECLNQVETVLNAETVLAFKPKASIWQVRADELLLGQALFELSLNAQDAMPNGGRLTIDLDDFSFAETDLADHPDRQAGDFVRVRVSDTGRGVPPEIRARMFEPFFTTKDTGQAVGIGLPLVAAVAEQHHGWVECHSRVGHGTHFDLYLPRADV